MVYKIFYKIKIGFTNILRVIYGDGTPCPGPLFADITCLGTWTLPLSSSSLSRTCTNFHYLPRYLVTLPYVRIFRPQQTRPPHLLPPHALSLSTMPRASAHLSRHPSPTSISIAHCMDSLVRQPPAHRRLPHIHASSQLRYGPG